MTNQFLRICERISNEGFACLAPELFFREYAKGADVNDHVALSQSLDQGACRRDLEISINNLRRLGASSVGVFGFCMGGSYAYRASLWGLDIQCAAPFYGPIDQDLTSSASCPLRFFYGGSDPYISRLSIEKAEELYPGQVVVYPDAGHAFMRDGTSFYDEAVANDAWRRLLTFLRTHLV